MWLTRPLTPKVLDAASKNVIQLCRLRCVLMEKLIDRMGLYIGIDYYVNSVKQLSDEEYEGYSKVRVKHYAVFTCEKNYFEIISVFCFTCNH